MNTVSFWPHKGEITRTLNIPSADGSIRVLGDLLVGLLGGTAGGLLGSLGDVVGTLLDRLHCERCRGLEEKFLV